MDFSRALVVMTSNLGTREMSELISGGMGFAAAKAKDNGDDTDQKIYRAALEAARRNFSPEFMNRIDKVVVFRSLQEHHLRQILDLELQAVQNRIIHSDGSSFIFQCSDAVKEILLEEGIDRRYGARHLKRAVERILVYPLANLIATRQVRLGDFVYVDVRAGTDTLIFSRYSCSDAAREVAMPDIARIAGNSHRLPVGGGVYSLA